MSSPLPLPRSVQEVILAKLSLKELLRSRAACKYWRRISGTKSFYGRYGAQIISTLPAYLFLHSRTGFILACDTAGVPRFKVRNAWTPTSKSISIISTSKGLLLLLDQRSNSAHFTVLNPLTEKKRDLPAILMRGGRELSYSQLLCSEDDSSYQVFVLGVMDADKSSGTLYRYNLQLPPDSGYGGPSNVKKYKKPFMLVYSSTSDSWEAFPRHQEQQQQKKSSSTFFPAGFVLPFMIMARCKAHQSLIIGQRLYCVTNAKSQAPAENIACFDAGKMEWLPELLQIPDSVLLLCLMEDAQGKLLLLVANRERMAFSTAVIEEGKVVVKGEINLPEEVYPGDGVMLGMTEVWGYGDALVLHVPRNYDPKTGASKWDVEQWDGRSLLYTGGNIAGEPEVYNWFCSLREPSSCTEFTPGGAHIPIGAHVTGAVDLMKMAFFPSIRLP